MGTGRDGEDANDTTACQHLEIRQMDQSTCSPGCELCTAAEYIQSTGNARLFVVAQNIYSLANV